MNEITKAKLIAELSPLFCKLIEKYGEEIDGLVPPDYDEHLALIVVQSLCLMSSAAVYQRDEGGDD